MTGYFKKAISIFTIIILLVFQTVNVQAIEIPTPPPEPASPPIEVQIAPPPAPEAPTPPPIPALDPVSDPTPAPTETDQSSNDDTDPNNTLQPSSQNNQTEQIQSNLAGPAADGNVGDTTINTGDGLTSGTLTTEANTNTALQELTQSTGNETNAENTNNGSGSDNSATSGNESSTNIIQDNNADINNNLNLDTNTGESSASQNVGNSVVTTGDANTSATAVTMANTNLEGLVVSEFNMVDDTQGNLILDFAAGCILGCGIYNPTSAVSSGNGTSSTNNSEIDQIANNNTFQNNDAVLENNATLTANSGNNQTNQNTGGDSSIETGDANVSANVISFLNNNIAGNVILGVVNIFGDLIGDIILPEEQLNTPLASASNIGNGSGSTNSALIDHEINNNTFQTNDALIQNNLNFEANTGGNQTSGNTGGNSSVETGDATIESQTVNIANSNMDGGNWWLVLVNEAGSWVGKILGAEDQSNMAGSTGTQFTVDPNGDITVTNTGNGAGSENTASSSQTANNNTVQNNVAQIINNLNIFANTGRNSASNNTGGDSTIKTGDANIVANLVNFVNNNIAGNGRLTITIVNVFGKWIGDFVSPGQQKEAKDEAAASSGDSSTNSANQSENSTPGLSFTSQTNTNNETITNNEAINQLQPTLTFPSASQDLNPDNQQSYIAGIKFDNNEKTLLPSEANASQTQSKSKTIELNLAWLLLLLPTGIIMVVAKRKIN